MLVQNGNKASDKIYGQQISKYKGYIREFHARNQVQFHARSQQSAIPLPSGSQGACPPTNT